VHLNGRIKFQLAFFVAVTVIAGGIMAFGYLDVGGRLFGIGHYRIAVELPRAGGLYPNANVTYRGTTVGRVTTVVLTDHGARAELTMDTGHSIPQDSDAHVHSQTAIGEAYIDLVPRSGRGAAIKNGDVIAADHTTLPPDINALLNATNNGLQAIPHDNLNTAINEAYAAVGGLGPELSRIIRGYNTISAEAHANLDALTTIIDQSKPVLDTQTNSADAIQAWAANLDDITHQLQSRDDAVAGLLDNGPAAVDQARQLVDRLQPTLPVVLANLVSLNQVAITYQPNLEQLLVLLPMAVGNTQGALLANRDTKQSYKGIYLSFNTNVNAPPPCNTGFLPPQQKRSPSDTDAPERVAGDLYCRVPQDSAIAVRGARNIPCATRPGKRAPTVKMCESDDVYVPLNDGYNWKGDPNATLSGQPVPQPTPQESPARGAPAVQAPPPPVAIAYYDPATGSYVGPDGHRYTQADLAGDSAPAHTWQDLLIPQKGR
jgi:phospholipid/cholesterol/gamma-HCH transport system substrate-binding protein